MNNEFYFQLYGFLKTFYGGIIIGFIYDSISKIIYFTTKKLTISDVIFWLVGFVLILNIFFNASYLSLRGFLVFGFILGWSLYYFLVSPFYKKILNYIFHKSESYKKNLEILAKKEKEKIKIKYKEPIRKINVGLKRIRNLPFDIKMQYNKLNKIKNNEANINVKTKRRNKLRQKKTEKNQG